MVRYLLIAFIIYIAYRFLFHFLIPVIRTTRQVKKGFREMHERMQQQQAGSPFQKNPETDPVPTRNNDDYIDYEEVR